MDEKEMENAVKIEVTQDESEHPSGIEDKSPETEEIIEEKPLEKMTKKELIQKLCELKDEVDSNCDLYLRSKAELDNVIKRNRKDKEDWVKYSSETIIKEILPVMDNLEMAIAHSKDENSLEALREGVELTLKGLKDTLKKAGLKEVESKGEPFDPCYHHAVSEQNHEDVEAGHVLEELQKGYMLHERLIRPSMVVLSKGGTGNGDSQKKVSDQVCEQDI